MKNLKINNEKFKRLMSFGLACVLAGSFTGCASKNNKKEDKVVCNNKMISLAYLDLRDTKTNVIIDDKAIEAVIVDDKLDKEFELFDIIYDSNVDSVLVNDELIDADRFELVNSTTNETVKIDYYFDSTEEKLIPMDEYIKETRGVDSTLTQETVDEEEYEELTDEKFYALVDEVYKKYSEIGLDVSKEEVIDYVMLVNIERIAKDNKELIATIVGNRKVENVEYNAFDVYSAVMTRNNYNYCNKNLGWDSLILVNDTVFDKSEKQVVINIENRIKEIFDARNNKDEFNKLLNKLLMEMLEATEEEFNMEYGVGYSTMNILVNFVRRNFTNTLDKANAELIKYFISYAEEYQTSYYANSRSTAYYSGIYNLLTDTLTCSKTRTK